MSLVSSSSSPARSGAAAPDLDADLERARLRYWEDSSGSLDVAVQAQEQGRLRGDEALQSRALTLQGAISMHRGDLGGAFALAAASEALVGSHLLARTELASLNTH